MKINFWNCLTPEGPQCPVKMEYESLVRPLFVVYTIVGAVASSGIGLTELIASSIDLNSGKSVCPSDYNIYIFVFVMGIIRVHAAFCSSGKSWEWRHDYAAVYSFIGLFASGAMFIATTLLQQRAGDTCINTLKSNYGTVWKMFLAEYIISIIETAVFVLFLIALRVEFAVYGMYEKWRRPASGIV